MEVFGWGKSKGSGGFCMVLVWFSYGFSMVLVRFSYGFSWVFIYCNIYRNILQLLDVPWSWWHIWLVGQGHPVLKNMSSSIGMMTETQYFWENSKNGNQTTNQTINASFSSSQTVGLPEGHDKNHGTSETSAARRIRPLQKHHGSDVIIKIYPHKVVPPQL